MTKTAFIDCLSLNVVYKSESGFILAKNYAGALDSLAIDLQGLELGFNVYLTLWPRPDGSGDFIVSQLSNNGYDFRASREEIQSLFDFFCNIPGVGNVYLCDGLSNFVSTAKLDTFESVFFRGKNVYHIKADKKVVSLLEVFPNPVAFQEEYPNCNCYGDMDLVNIPQLRAAYPSLTEWDDSSIVGCAAMIASDKVDSYKCRLTTDLLGEQQQKLPEAPKPIEQPVQPMDQAVADEDDDEEVEEDLPVQRKESWTFGQASLVAVCLVLSVAAGTLFGLGRAWDTIRPRLTDVTAMTHASTVYSEYSKVYSGASNLQKLQEILEYCKSNAESVEVTGWEYTPTQVVLNCRTPDAMGKTSFLDFVGGSYYVASSTDLGNEGATLLFQVVISI